MVDPVRSEYLQFIARPQRLSSCSSRISAIILDHLENGNKDPGEPIGRSSTSDKMMTIQMEVLSR